MANVIVDFDGTIADSLPVIIDLFKKWSKQESITTEEVETFRSMAAKDVVRAVGVPLWRVPGLLARGRKDFAKYIDKIDVFKGMPETIAKMHKKGHKLYLMSSNSKQNVQKYLELHEIDMYFEGIYGNAGLFSKARAMKKIIKRHRIERANCYSIGDEARDIEAAKKAGITSIAVTWGFNNKEILKTYNPNYIISSPSEIIKLVK